MAVSDNITLATGEAGKPFVEKQAPTLSGETLGLVGTAYKGPAFVPRTVKSYAPVENNESIEDFESIFGTIDENVIKNTSQTRLKWGNVSAKSWFNNGNEQLNFTRVLGISEDENVTAFTLAANFNASTIKAKSSFLINLTKNYEVYKNFIGENKIITSIFVGNQAGLVDISGGGNTGIYDFYNSYQSSNKNYRHEEFVSRKNLVYTDYRLNSKQFLNSFENEETFKQVDIPFEANFKTAKSPWLVSQAYKNIDDKVNIKDNVKRMFRFWALDDGEAGNRLRFKVTPKIIPEASETKEKTKWAIFDVEIHELNKNLGYKLLESYVDVDMNPRSVNFIARRIGNVHTYFDIESKKVNVEGEFRNISKVVRVELAEEFLEGRHENYNLAPVGFIGYPYVEEFLDNNNTAIYLGPKLKGTQYRDNIEDIIEDNNSWGISFNTYKIELDKEKKIVIDKLIKRKNLQHVMYSKYLPALLDPNENEIEIRDFDFFTLEKIRFAINSSDDFKHSFYNFTLETTSSHNENEIISQNNFIDIRDKLKQREGFIPNEAAYKNLSFEFFAYGGFDGTNILDEAEYHLNPELCDELNKPLVYEAYNTAINSSLDNSNHYPDLFLAPGITNQQIQKEIQNVINLTDCIYIADVPQYFVGVEKSSQLYFFNSVPGANPQFEAVEDYAGANFDANTSIINFNALDTNNIFYNLGLFEIEQDLSDDTTFKSELPASIYTLSKIKSENYKPLDMSNNDSNIVDVTTLIGISDNTNDAITLRKLANNSNINIYYNSGDRIKLNSSNISLFNKRLSLRYFSTRRVLNTIKRELRDKLLVGIDPLMFNIINDRTILQTNILLVLNRFVSDGLIKNFTTNMQNSSSKNYNQNKLNNTVKLSVYIELFTGAKETDNFISLTLDDILSSNSTINNNEVELVVYAKE